MLPSSSFKAKSKRLSSHFNRSTVAICCHVNHISEYIMPSRLSGYRCGRLTLVALRLPPPSPQYPPPASTFVKMARAAYRCSLPPFARPSLGFTCNRSFYSFRASMFWYVARSPYRKQSIVRHDKTPLFKSGPVEVAINAQPWPIKKREYSGTNHALQQIQAVYRVLRPSASLFSRLMTLDNRIYTTIKHGC